MATGGKRKPRGDTADTNEITSNNIYVGVEVEPVNEVLDKDEEEEDAKSYVTTERSWYKITRDTIQTNNRRPKNHPRRHGRKPQR